jgi:hypothetical protein
MVASGGEGKPKQAIGARQDVNRALFTALEERGRAGTIRPQAGLPAKSLWIRGIASAAGPVPAPRTWHPQTPNAS